MKVGLTEKLIPIRVESVRDIARIAANIIALGQIAYIVRLKHAEKTVLGLVAVLRDYYDLYGLPVLYYYIDNENKYRENRYILVKVDEEGEHIEPSNTARRGWIPVPVIALAEQPAFFPKTL